MVSKPYKITLIVLIVAGFWDLGAFSAYDCPHKLAGDLNEDCCVDFVDLAILAQNWIVDCNLTPENPACLPKWEPEPPMSIGRDQFTGGVVNGKIYVFGGNGNPDQVNLKSTEMFDPATSDWSNRADNNHNGGMGVEELTGAVVDSNLYVFGAWGGIGPGGHYGDFNFNERYDPNTDTWTSLAPKPTVVTSAPATVYNGEIYLFGGGYCYEDSNDDVHCTNYDVVEAYRPATNTWRFVTNMPILVMMPAVATVGDKAYVIGGYLPNEDRMSADVMIFDFQSEQWDTNSCQPLPADRARAFEYGSAAPVVGGKIFLIGGAEGDWENHWPSGKIDVYDTATNTSQTGTSLPLPWDDHLSVVCNDKIYVIGGCNGYDFVNGSKSGVISLSIQEE
jgi:N-acetylneuraminic acid mutarotase